MWLQVLALDYDGTIATEGAIDPEVRAAIAEARARDVAVLLVTGRILADLQRVLGELALFDAIVAENGAVLHFPGSGRSLLLATPPPPLFVDELRRREIPFLAGECVVEADAAHAGAVLAVIRDTQLPLVLLFDRGRMMVLPQAVSKATGLREALRALRLSAHDTVAVGDAENDHQLLAVSELGVAVAWGSAALQAVADEILPGDGPAAVAGFVRDLLRDPRIAAARLQRRRLRLGLREGGAPFEIALRGRNVLIAGDTQSGKSWVAGVLCEQLVLEHYCVCVIDPEGEYATLEALPSVVVFDADPHPPGLDDVERTLRYPDISVVLDLAAMELEAKRGYVHALLGRLSELRRRTGLPHRIVVDEAHYFLQDRAVTSLLELGFGGYTVVTWHASHLEPDLLASSDVILATRISDPDEALALHALRGQDVDRAPWCAQLRGLEDGQAALLPGAAEAGGALVPFRVSARLTAHVRHRQKYLNRQVGEEQAFVLRAPGMPEQRARSLAALLGLLAAAPDLGEHLRRRDLSRWIHDVFGDRVLAHRIRALEEGGEAGRLAQPHAALIDAIRSRYGAEGAAATAS